jgi:uncharacterized protein YdhG (YjbR/CyaY superfamily)
MRRPKDTDSYLAALPAEQRVALAKLRGDIKAAAPAAEEYIGYAMPAFRYKGPLVYFAAAKNHCAFYVGSTIAKHKADLVGYDTSTGTIRFQPKKPLPKALVRKLVRTRMAENDRLCEERKARVERRAEQRRAVRKAKKRA